MLLPAALDGSKQILQGIELKLKDFVGQMEAKGKVADIENPDDAAVENSGTDVAVTWPSVCQPHGGSPCE